jgi:hypothetical protein
MLVYGFPCCSTVPFEIDHLSHWFLNAEKSKLGLARDQLDHVHQCLSRLPFSSMSLPISCEVNTRVVSSASVKSDILCSPVLGFVDLFAWVPYSQARKAGDELDRVLS